MAVVPPVTNGPSSKDAMLEALPGAVERDGRADMITIWSCGHIIVP